MAKFGRRYLILLWVGLTTILLGVLLVGLARTATIGVVDQGFWKGVVIIILIALATGIAAWGVERRRGWSYYFSLVLSLLLIASHVGSLATLEESNRRLAVPVPWWLPTAFLVAIGMGFFWLVLPGARAEFSPRAKKT